MGCSRWPPQPDGSGSDVSFTPKVPDRFVAWPLRRGSRNNMLRLAPGLIDQDGTSPIGLYRRDLSTILRASASLLCEAGIIGSLREGNVMDHVPASARVRKLRRTAIVILIISGNVNYLDRATLAGAQPP